MKNLSFIRFLLIVVVLVLVMGASTVKAGPEPLFGRDGDGHIYNVIGDSILFVVGACTLRVNSTGLAGPYVPADADSIQGLPISVVAASYNYILRIDPGDSCWWDAEGVPAGGGWTDDGGAVRLTTITDVVGIGTTVPPKKLSVAGDIATGDTATGDVDVFHYFSTNGSWITEYLKWDDSLAGFYISDDFDVTGNVTVSGTVDGVDVAALNTGVGADSGNWGNAWDSVSAYDDGGIVAAHIATGAVTTTEILDGTIDAPDIKVASKFEFDGGAYKADTTIADSILTTREELEDTATAVRVNIRDTVNAIGHDADSIRGIELSPGVDTALANHDKILKYNHDSLRLLFAVDATGAGGAGLVTQEDDAVAVATTDTVNFETGIDVQNETNNVRVSLDSTWVDSIIDTSDAAYSDSTGAILDGGVDSADMNAAEVDEYIQDKIAPMVSNNIETQITVTYYDSVRMVIKVTPRAYNGYTYKDSINTDASPPSWSITSGATVASICDSAVGIINADAQINSSVTAYDSTTFYIIESDSAGIAFTATVDTAQDTSLSRPNNANGVFDFVLDDPVDSADGSERATKDSDGSTINTTYLKLAGGTMTGNLNMGNQEIQNVKKIAADSVWADTFHLPNPDKAIAGGGYVERLWADSALITYLLGQNTGPTGTIHAVDTFVIDTIMKIGGDLLKELAYYGLTVEDYQLTVDTAQLNATVWIDSVIAANRAWLLGLNLAGLLDTLYSSGVRVVIKDTLVVTEGLRVGAGTGAVETDTVIGHVYGLFDKLAVGDTGALLAYTFPEVDGTSGQVLKTDGSKVLTWQGDAGAPISVEEADVEVDDSLSTLDFGAGFDLTETPAHEVNVILDYTEDPVNLNSSEITGELQDANVANNITVTESDDVDTTGTKIAAALADRLTSADNYWSMRDSTTIVHVNDSTGDTVIFITDSLRALWRVSAAKGNASLVYNTGGADRWEVKADSATGSFVIRSSGVADRFTITSAGLITMDSVNIASQSINDDSSIVSEGELEDSLDGYQPLEATLTDIADGTIAENLVNVAFPWTDSEVDDAITVTGYMQDADINTFSELQAWVSDKTLLNDADTATITALWVFTQMLRVDNDLQVEGNIYINKDSTAADAVLYFQDDDEIVTFHWDDANNQFEMSDGLDLITGNLDISSGNITLSGTVDGIDVSTIPSVYAPLASPTFTGTVTIPTPFTLGAVSVTPTGTELNYVDGVTSAIQTQLDAKEVQLNNEAGLYAVLSDVTDFVQPSEVPGLETDATALAAVGDTINARMTKAVTGNTETRIAVTYNSTDSTYDFVVDDMNDDVPESGDFGAAADLEATGALSIDVVAPAEMADADHGDISWTAGVASIDDSAITDGKIDRTDAEDNWLNAKYINQDSVQDLFGEPFDRTYFDTTGDSVIVQYSDTAGVALSTADRDAAFLGYTVFKGNISHWGEINQLDYMDARAEHATTYLKLRNAGLYSAGDSTICVHCDSSDQIHPAFVYAGEGLYASSNDTMTNGYRRHNRRVLGVGPICTDDNQENPHLFVKDEKYGWHEFFVGVESTWICSGDDSIPIGYADSTAVNPIYDLNDSLFFRGDAWNSGDSSWNVNLGGTGHLSDQALFLDFGDTLYMPFRGTWEAPSPDSHIVALGYTANGYQWSEGIVILSEMLCTNRGDSAPDRALGTSNWEFKSPTIIPDTGGTYEMWTIENNNLVTDTNYIVKWEAPQVDSAWRWVRGPGVLGRCTYTPTIAGREPWHMRVKRRGQDELWALVAEQTIGETGANTYLTIAVSYDDGLSWQSSDTVLAKGSDVWNDNRVYACDGAWVNEGNRSYFELYYSANGTGHGWATAQTELLFTGDDKYAGFHDFGNADSLQIPTGVNPSTVTEGQISWDSDDDAIEVTDGTNDMLIPALKKMEVLIWNPDLITDTVPIFFVDSAIYQGGIEIVHAEIQASVDGAYTLEIIEFSAADPPVSEGAIGGLAIAAADQRADTTTFTDATIAVGNIVTINTPATDIDWIRVSIRYYVKENN